MEPLLLRGQVLFPDGVLRPGALSLANGRIEDVQTVAQAPDEIIAPGFIDLQVNGAFGHDITSDPELIYHIASALLATGVTAFLPTIVSSPLETYRKAFEVRSALELFAASGNQARILGWHLEGPYLSPQRSGAHDPHCLRPRADPLGDGLIDPAVRLMTLAPELENGPQAVADLRAHGVVVSLGHSAASYEQALAAFDAGITWGTHLFNAMLPMHHREPGVVGALLAD